MTESYQTVTQQGLLKTLIFRDIISKHRLGVTPAQAGIHNAVRYRLIDSRLCGNDIYSEQ